MTPAQAMNQVTAKLVTECGSPYNINDGLCEEWAYDVIDLLPDTSIEVWETLFNFADTTHIFIKIDNLFYDAECLEGNQDFAQLPIFKKLDRPQPVMRVDWYNGPETSDTPSYYNCTEQEILENAA